MNGIFHWILCEKKFPKKLDQQIYMINHGFVELGKFQEHTLLCIPPEVGHLADSDDSYCSNSKGKFNSLSRLDRVFILITN